MIRLRKYLTKKGLWSEDEENKYADECKEDFKKAMKEADSVEPEKVTDMLKRTFEVPTPDIKEQIKKYIEETFHYDLHQSCRTIRKDYNFDVTCQGSVPPSITAFLESNDYEHAVRLAVSLGGDADTMGAITGSIAEAYYQKIPDCIRQEVMRRLPSEFIELIRRFSHQYFIPSF